jgi:amidase
LTRWNEAQVDALIMPVTPYIGYTPKTWIKSSQYVGYTGHWNFVDYAAFAVPWTTVDTKVDFITDGWKQHVPRNESDRFNQEQCRLCPLNVNFGN